MPLSDKDLEEAKPIIDSLRKFLIKHCTGLPEFEKRFAELNPKVKYYTTGGYAVRTTSLFDMHLISLYYPMGYIYDTLEDFKDSTKCLDKPMDELPLYLSSTDELERFIVSTRLESE
jgi:hypothetical protein